MTPAVLRAGLIGAGIAGALRLLGVGCIVRVGGGPMELVAGVLISALIGFLIGCAVGRATERR